MKICPRCEAELKDSVIRCVRCGQTVRGEETVSDPDPAQLLAPAPSTSPVWAGVAAPATTVPAVSSPPVATPPTAPPKPMPRPAPHRPHPPIADQGSLRALPTRRHRFGPDPIMMLAGLGAASAGVFAYLSIPQPWVHLTVTRVSTDVTPELIATLSLRGRAALIGTAGTGIAIALGVLGVLWLFYGLQRGWSMPGLLNPAFGILLAIAGLIATVLGAMVWFVWQDAMILRARAAGLSTQGMRKLLDPETQALVQVQRLSGLMTFGGMMALGLVASCFGWYAYRRRD